MKTYELTYIISSGITLDEVDAITKEVETFIQAGEGVILHSEKTTAQTLAYPIKKQSSGYYVITTFQIAESKIKELKALLEKQKDILRHFILYKRPVKEMEVRRTRRPMPATEAAIVENKDKKKGEKAEIEEINKKLDEILSE